MSVNQQSLMARLKELQGQHQALHEKIELLLKGEVPDQLRIKRLKKKKLQYKDEILIIEDQLFPDIIA